MLDRLYAANIIGDDTSNIAGPFETSQACFYWGRVIPLCARWYGKCNEDLNKIICILAHEAAAGVDGVTISPLVNSNRKGGAAQIMLQHG